MTFLLCVGVHLLHNAYMYGETIFQDENIQSMAVSTSGFGLIS